MTPVEKLTEADIRQAIAEQVCMPSRAKYGVMWGPTDEREHEDFDTRREAVRFALRLHNAGEREVMLDIYSVEDGEQEWTDYVSLPSVANDKSTN